MQPAPHRDNPQGHQNDGHYEDGEHSVGLPFLLALDDEPDGNVAGPSRARLFISAHIGERPLAGPDPKAEPARPASASSGARGS